jgi:hypothetical protein
MVMEQNKKLLIPYSLNIKQNDAEMSLSDHLEELRERAFWSVAVLISSIVLSVDPVSTVTIKSNILTELFNIRSITCDSSLQMKFNANFLNH